MKGFVAKVSFGETVASWARQTHKTLDQVHQETIKRLFSSIVMDTPVLTGLARGNWQTRVGTDPSGPISRLDPLGVEVLAEIERNLGKAGDTVYMSNQVPYIDRLERGWSKQAPSGMLRRNVSGFGPLVKVVVEELK